MMIPRHSCQIQILERPVRHPSMEEATLRRLVLSVLIVSASVVCAAVKPGQNILINGAFEAEQLDFPMFWHKGGSQTSHDPTGGPGSTGAVVFSNPEGLDGIRVFCRQHDQQIVAGETYKISAYVRTQGFRSRHCGVIVHNNGWYKENGIRAFPENTDGWQYMERTFKLHESKGGIYGVAIFAINHVGEIQFAQVKLEAISDAALAGSSVSAILAEQWRPRLVPWKPLLNKIPLSAPRMTFHLFGKLERPLADYECVCTIDGTTVRTSPLARKLNAVDLSGIAAGDHDLDVAIVDRTAQKHVFQMKHVITLVAVPEIDVSAHRRLNNLVVEVLARPLQATAAAQAFDVFVDRRNSGRKKNDGKVRVNLNHIRFRATAPSFTVTFTDAKAAPGTEIALNYVMLKPYFEE